MRFSDVFPKTFSRLLRLLNEHNVPYLIIGGHAVGFHGYVRATKDLDVWIEPDERHALALRAVLRAMGVHLPTVEAMRLLREESGVHIGAGLDTIDLLFRIAGVDFAQCYQRSITTVIEGVSLTIIGLEDLRASKQAAGRLQDLLDLENLPGG
jgi:predicted nucleotidyltransferase